MRNPLGHGSVLAKKKVFLEAGMYKNVGPAEDYDLWLRIFNYRFAAHPDVLYFWRVNQAGISQSKASEQAVLANKLRKNLSESAIIPKRSSFKIGYSYYVESMEYPKGASFKEDYAHDQLEIGKNYFIKKNYGEGMKQYISFLLLFPSSLRIIYRKIQRRVLKIVGQLKQRVAGK